MNWCRDKAQIHPLEIIIKTIHHVECSLVEAASSLLKKDNDFLRTFHHFSKTCFKHVLVSFKVDLFVAIQNSLTHVFSFIHAAHGNFCLSEKAERPLSNVYSISSDYLTLFILSHTNSFKVHFRIFHRWPCQLF